jgi:UV DNA damage endonuclease
MVLDVHHHVCNNEGYDLEPLIKDIFNTWRGETISPKIHFSSPRNGEKDRKHSDYIDVNSFVQFIEMCKPLDINFDVMLEAKKKDLSLYKLVRDIKEIRSHWKWIDETTFEV